jgi:hypothetical protein
MHRSSPHMDRNYDAPATQFALQILRSHPQISYEHAVSAAEYSGVCQLPRGVFFDAAERLGIRRDREERIEPASATGSTTSTASTAPTTPTLVEQLDQFRRGLAETAKIREALLRMQRVVRAALLVPDESRPR